MKVSDFYKEIDLEKLEDKSSENSYWQKSCDFVKQVWEDDMADLSKKQVEWLQKISEAFI